APRQACIGSGVRARWGFSSSVTKEPFYTAQVMERRGRQPRLQPTARCKMFGEATRTTSTRSVVVTGCWAARLRAQSFYTQPTAEPPGTYRTAERPSRWVVFGAAAVATCLSAVRAGSFSIRTTVARAGTP